MSTKYKNTDFNRCVDSGGADKVTIGADSKGQGGGGTSKPCKGCFVSPRSANSGVMRVNIGTDATADLGIQIPDADQGGPVFIPVDDIIQLYFYGTQNDIVEILYLLG